MLTMVFRKLRELGSNEQGLGMLEMILIIAVIVILAGIFRTQLKDIISSLLGKAKTKSESFMNDK
jgi:Tfp pilus assembly protein FimT